MAFARSASPTKCRTATSIIVLEVDHPPGVRVVRYPGRVMHVSTSGIAARIGAATFRSHAKSSFRRETRHRCGPHPELSYRNVPDIVALAGHHSPI
jgi:hypothetical protein